MDRVVVWLFWWSILHPTYQSHLHNQSINHHESIDRCVVVMVVFFVIYYYITFVLVIIAIAHPLHCFFLRTVPPSYFFILKPSPLRCFLPFSHCLTILLTCCYITKRSLSWYSIFFPCHKIAAYNGYVSDDCCWWWSIVVDQSTPSSSLITNIITRTYSLFTTLSSNSLIVRRNINVNVNATITIDITYHLLLTCCPALHYTSFPSFLRLSTITTHQPSSMSLVVS